MLSLPGKSLLTSGQPQIQLYEVQLYEVRLYEVRLYEVRLYDSVEYLSRSEQGPMLSRFGIHACYFLSTPAKRMPVNSAMSRFHVVRSEVSNC